MKRLFAISLTIIYLIFSVGVVIGYHYCGGKLDEVSLFKQPKECCADANTKKSCCNDSIAVFKITNDYSTNDTSTDVPQVEFIALAQVVFPIATVSLVRSTPRQMFALHKLKHLSKQPVYLINRVFIL